MTSQIVFKLRAFLTVLTCGHVFAASFPWHATAAGSAECDRLFKAPQPASRTRVGIVRRMLQLIKTDRPQALTEIERLERMVASGFGDIVIPKEFQDIFLKESEEFQRELGFAYDAETPSNLLNNASVALRIQRLHILADAVEYFRPPPPPVLL